MTTPFATDDTITVPIPKELAANFALDESGTLAKSRSHALLQLGTTGALVDHAQALGYALALIPLTPDRRPA